MNKITIIRIRLLLCHYPDKETVIQYYEPDYDQNHGDSGLTVISHLTHTARAHDSMQKNDASMHQLINTSDIILLHFGMKHKKNEMTR
jgi:hypothetical protein